MGAEAAHVVEELPGSNDVRFTKMLNDPSTENE